MSFLAREWRFKGSKFIQPGPCREEILTLTLYPLSNHASCSSTLYQHFTSFAPLQFYSSVTKQYYSLLNLSLCTAR